MNRLKITVKTTETMRPRVPRRSRGFTLIEMMMAILVGTIVLLGMFAFSSIQQGTATLHHRSVRINQALEGAMWTMGRDIRAAGLGFTRSCTELRIWSAQANRLINPGAADDDSTLATDVYVDPTTSEPYWVLRDGLQGHWRSTDANAAGLGLDTSSISGGAVSSASPESAADSFDVIMGERNFVAGSGVFKTVDVPTSSSSTANVEVESNPIILDSTNSDHLAWVIQMMPPGSFFVLSRDNLQPAATYQTFEPQAQSQCALMQVTGPVTAGSSSSRWLIPVSNISEFNANLAALVDTTSEPVYGSTDPVLGVDWLPTGTDGPAVPRVVVPLGRLRWSRYEVDYTLPTRPYLVRTDIIGVSPGDPVSTGSAGAAVPGCPSGSGCPLAQLHIPGLGAAGAVASLPRIAVGPMIEDMQVAVGCDGWVAGSNPVLNALVAAPDVGFEEKGDASNLANSRVDELETNRANDEWLGNAAEEQWGPDCVYYGTGEFRRGAWPSSGPTSETLVGPGFRTSPQVFRVTIAAKSETESQFTDAPSVLYPIEDRPEINSVAPGSEYYTVTETFAPSNLRWRNPLM